MATCPGVWDPQREAQSYSAGHSFSRKVTNKSGWDWITICRTRDYLIFQHFFSLEDLAGRTLLETPCADLGYNDVPSLYLQFALLLWKAFGGAHVCAHTHEAVHASQGKGAGSMSSVPFISWPETFVFKFHHIVQNLFCFNWQKTAAFSSFV